MQDILSLAKRAAQVDSFVMLTGETGQREGIDRPFHPRRIRPVVAALCLRELQRGLADSFGKRVFRTRQRGLSRRGSGPGGSFRGLRAEARSISTRLGRCRSKRRRPFCACFRKEGSAGSGRTFPGRLISGSLARRTAAWSRTAKAGRFRPDLYYRLCVIELGDTSATRPHGGYIAPLALPSSTR